LGVSPGTIDNMRHAGELPSVKLRGRRLFDVADLRRFIESRKGVAE
jgi:excisionase family DNA binding protein